MQGKLREDPKVFGRKRSRIVAMEEKGSFSSSPRFSQYSCQSPSRSLLCHILFKYIPLPLIWTFLLGVSFPSFSQYGFDLFALFLDLILFGTFPVSR